MLEFSLNCGAGGTLCCIASTIRSKNKNKALFNRIVFNVILWRKMAFINSLNSNWTFLIQHRFKSFPNLIHTQSKLQQYLIASKPNMRSSTHMSIKGIKFSQIIGILMTNPLIFSYRIFSCYIIIWVLVPYFPWNELWNARNFRIIWFPTKNKWG